MTEVTAPQKYFQWPKLAQKLGAWVLRSEDAPSHAPPTAEIGWIHDLSPGTGRLCGNSRAPRFFTLRLPHSKRGSAFSFFLRSCEEKYERGSNSARVCPSLTRRRPESTQFKTGSMRSGLQEQPRPCATYHWVRPSASDLLSREDRTSLTYRETDQASVTYRESAMSRTKRK